MRDQEERFIEFTGRSTLLNYTGKCLYKNEKYIVNGINL